MANNVKNIDLNGQLKYNTTKKIRKEKSGNEN